MNYYYYGKQQEKQGKTINVIERQRDRDRVRERERGDTLSCGEG